MMRFRAIFLACLAAAAVTAHSATVLVVQNRPIGTDDPDPQHNLLQMIGDKLNTDGRILPILWSETDVVYRSAVNDKLIRNTQTPSKSEILSAAEKLRAEYVLVITVWKNDASLQYRTELYKKGQLEWQDPVPTGLAATQKELPESRMLSVTGALDDDLRHLTGSLIDVLFNGPLVQLAPRPLVIDSGPEKGVVIRPAEVPPVPTVDNKALLEQVMKLLATGSNSQAIATLRDAVDAEPFNVERREVLVETLLNLGMTTEGADQARRAANVMPENAKLWALSARAWVMAGRVDEAQTDLNEAAARDPENAETRLLMAELAIGRQEFTAAATHLEVVFSKAPSEDAFWIRALMKLFTTGEESAKQDTVASGGQSLDPIRKVKRYRQVIVLTDKMLENIGDEARTLFSAVRRDPKEEGLLIKVTAAYERASRVSSALDWVESPKENITSDGERRLALKLLSQSLGELLGYIQAPSADAIDDATINLGEGLRRLKVAQETYRLESAN